MKKYFKDRTFWLVIINLGLAIYFLLSEFFTLEPLAHNEGLFYITLILWNASLIYDKRKKK